MNTDTVASALAEAAPRVASQALGDFAKAMASGQALPPPRRLHLDQENTRNGVAQLVLTLVKLLHELLEKQAIRRIDAGSLTEAEIERLGLTLMRQAEELARITREFGFADEDLNLDLGPLGKLL